MNHLAMKPHPFFDALEFQREYTASSTSGSVFRLIATHPLKPEFKASSTWVSWNQIALLTVKCDTDSRSNRPKEQSTYASTTHHHEEPLPDLWCVAPIDNRLRDRTGDVHQT